MNWLLVAFITNTISLLSLVAAYLYMWRGGRQPSMGLWGLGWAVYMIRFLAMAGELLSVEPVPWRFASLATLGLSAFLLWAGTRSFIGHPLPPRTYAWGVLPVAWALVAFIPLPVDSRIVAAPIFFFSGLVDLFSALILFQYAHAVGGRRSPWALGLAYGAWAVLKIGHLFIPPLSFSFFISLLLTNGLALGLAFVLIGLSLIEAERNARRRADRLNALAALTSAAGRLLSPPDLLAAALEEIRRLLEIESGIVAFLVEEEGQMRRVAAQAFSPLCLVQDLAGPPEGCLCARAAIEGRMVRETPSCHLADCGIGLAIPLPARGRVLGVIGAALPAERHLSEGEQRTLETLGRQLGTALENAGLAEAMEQEVKRLQALVEASRGMIAKLDLQSVTQGIVAAAQGALEIDRAALYLCDPKGGRGEVGYAEGLSRSFLDLAITHAESLAGFSAVQEKEMVYVEDAQHAPGAPRLQEASRQEGSTR